MDRVAILRSNTGSRYAVTIEADELWFIEVWTNNPPPTDHMLGHVSLDDIRKAIANNADGNVGDVHFPGQPFPEPLWIDDGDIRAGCQHFKHADVVRALRSCGMTS